MEGYSVTEAASVLGVPTERVWELLARGILAGAPDGETGMRVFLQPRPAPASPIPSPAAGIPPSEAREPDREPSAFRELLTEFRNLTERYGQALLALGESRGEVAALRSRVDLLEARMELRLPSGASSMPPAATGWASPPTPPLERTVEPAAPHAAETETGDAEDRASRRRGARRATESFAEALARAEDPTAPELPGAAEAAAAIAALREESGQAADSTPEVALPREVPSADPVPIAEEPEPLPVEPEPLPVQPEPLLVEPEPLPEGAPSGTTEEAATIEPNADDGLAADQTSTSAVEGAEGADEVQRVDETPIQAEAPELALSTEGSVVPDEAPEALSDRVVDAAAHLEPSGLAPALHEFLAAEAEPSAELEPSERSAAELDTDATASVPEPEADAAASEVEPDAAIEPAESGNTEPYPSTAWIEEEQPEPADADEPEPAAPVGHVTEVAEIGRSQDAVAAAASQEPVEPLAWDQERYTTEIEEPDWYAGIEEPAPQPESAVETLPIEDPSDTATFVSPPPAAVARSEPEETMMWFGRRPASEPEPGPASSAADPDEEGASEMEVATTGHPQERGEFPGSRDLDDALAALDALARRPEAPPAADAVADREAPWQPRPSTSASRAYRRLRRIFPG